MLGSTGSQATFEYRELQLVAITVLGLYLIANGLTDLVYHVATILPLRNQSPDNFPIPATVAGGIAGSIVETLLGTAFCVGAKGMLRIIERMRG